jgi:hypothetical protein
MSNDAHDRVREMIHADDGLYHTVIRLKQLPFDLDPVLEQAPDLRAALFDRADAATALALRDGWPEAKLDFHRALHECLKLRMSKHKNRHEFSYNFTAITTRMIKAWLAHETQKLDGSDLSGLGPNGFKPWFVQTLAQHPAPDHSLYTYLEERADLRAFKYFVIQEKTVDAEFADLIAQTQVGAGPGSKIEMARNYWDEMGCGNPQREHGALFSGVLSSLDIADVDESKLTWASLAGGNLFAALSSHRFYYHMSVGCIAATEIAVPKRFERIIRGGRRLSVPPAVIEYYQEHVLVDPDHADGWLEEVVVPIVAHEPDAAVDVATGVLLRLNTSKAYCDCLLETLRNGAF